MWSICWRLQGRGVSLTGTGWCAYRGRCRWHWSVGLLAGQNCLEWLCCCQRLLHRLFVVFFFFFDRVVVLDVLDFFYFWFEQWIKETRKTYCKILLRRPLRNPLPLKCALLWLTPCTSAGRFLAVQRSCRSRGLTSQTGCLPRWWSFSSLGGTSHWLHLLWNWWTRIHTPERTPGHPWLSDDR